MLPVHKTAANLEGDMEDEKQGRCMCGAVRFGFSGEPRFVGECVCESCRRAHGASVVPWLGVMTEQFQILSGEADLSWYASSKDSERGFCQRCGTRLFFRSSRWAGETHMTLACMDSPEVYRSTGVAFIEELPVWSKVQFSGHNQP